MKRVDELTQFEISNLKQLYASSPDLFENNPSHENAELLQSLGIHIPGKESLPEVFFKLWPEDFIVEEIGVDGTVHSVQMQELNTPDGAPQATIYATLVKCNISTPDAVADIANQLGIQEKSIRYAGIKDKQAITAQKISIRDTSIDKVKNVSSKHYFLKDLSYGKGALNVGELQGNRFTIYLRNAESLEGGKLALIQQKLEEIQKNGFYNFYYIQRFGIPRLISYSRLINYYWAKLIFQGEYKEAIEHLLTYSTQTEMKFMQMLRNEIKSVYGNWEAVKGILENYPVTFQYELKVVDHLIKNPEDYAGALGTIKGQVAMWINALSSWFFNVKLSNMIKAGRGVPHALPLVTNKNENDRELYSDVLTQANLFPLPVQNVQQFTTFQTNNYQETMHNVEVYMFHQTEHGFIVQFDLPKGAYATTFLSHIFNLVSGGVPLNVKQDRVDSLDTLGQHSAIETIEHFSEVSSEQGNMFSKSSKE